MRRKLTGLYAITDANQTDQTQLIKDVTQALLGGVRILQYRDKSKQHDLRLSTGKQLRALTRQYDALLIINDDVQLAIDTNADGVHLGADDTSIAKARNQLGTAAIVGVSCYNDLSLAKKAASDGANYVAFGRFFPSRTKPNAIQTDTKILHTAKHELDIPIVAIGGITSQNGKTLVKAGADMLAVVDDIFSQTDIQTGVQQYQKIFTIPSSEKQT